MKYFKQTLRELQIGIIFFGILNIAIGMWFFDDKLDYVLGGVLGTVTGLVLSDNMARAIEKAVCNPYKANVKVRIAYILRYLIEIIVVLIALLSPWVNWVATFIGIFVLKFATFLTPLIHKINLKINPNALESDGSEDIDTEEAENESAITDGE